jgi:hypothetical protein
MEATPSQYGLWGPHDTQEIRWRGHNPWDLARNLRGLELTIRTGNGQPGGPYGGGDPIEAGVHAMSVSMHQKLERFGIPHVWDDYGPGGHAWPYWKRDLRETLPDLLATFRHPPSRPTHFSFTAAEPTYEDYGWRVAVHRKAMEWSHLHVSGRRGFRLSGSGVGLVRTAAIFRPGSRHLLATRCPSGRTHAVKRAGAKGSLRMRLPLGPANPDQEYTAAAQLTGTKVFTCDVRISGSPGR